MLSALLAPFAPSENHALQKYAIFLKVIEIYVAENFDVINSATLYLKFLTFNM